MSRDKEEFKKVVEPVMKYLCYNCNPHQEIVITQNTAELKTADYLYKNDEFIQD